MRLLDWFKVTSIDKQNDAPPPPLIGALKDECTVHGLDFIAAIEAHRKWRERLTKYVQGQSEERLDAGVICRDDQCALGKWIYKDGMPFTGHLPVYHQLKAKHAAFHISAGNVVALKQGGQTEQAMQVIMEGDFAKNSREVQTLISRLYMEIKTIKQAE